MSVDDHRWLTLRTRNCLHPDAVEKEYHQVLNSLWGRLILNVIDWLSLLVQLFAVFVPSTALLPSEWEDMRPVLGIVFAEKIILKRLNRS